MALHCWNSHSRGILNGIRVAVAYNVTNCKLTNIDFKPVTCKGRKVPFAAASENFLLSIDYVYLRK